VVEDVARARTLHAEPVAAGATFRLAYTHSSEGVPVRGTLRVEADGALRVVETAFGGFGPGLPIPRAGERWAVEDGLLVQREPGPPLPELRLRVAHVSAQRLVLPSGVVLDLAALLPDGAPVRIAVVPGPPGP
jgi:hypothetical protein